MRKDSREDSSLKKHYKGEFLVYFRYFVECYFIPGSSYDELPRLIKEFKNSEASSKVDGLYRELNLIKENDEWDYIQQFVRKYGMRALNYEKLQQMVEILMNELS